MGAVGVVEWVLLRYVVAGLTAIGEISGTTEVEQDGLFLGLPGTNSTQYVLCQRWVRGRCTIDDDRVGSRKFFDRLDVVESAVDDSDSSKSLECIVKLCRSQEDGNWNVGVLLSEYREKGSYYVVSKDGREQDTSNAITSSLPGSPEKKHGL